MKGKILEMGGLEYARRIGSGDLSTARAVVESPPFAAYGRSDLGLAYQRAMAERARGGAWRPVVMVECRHGRFIPPDTADYALAARSFPFARSRGYVVTWRTSTGKPHLSKLNRSL
jgi:hypothetical protein